MNRHPPLGMSRASAEDEEAINLALRQGGVIGPRSIFAGNRFRLIVSTDRTHSGVRLHASLSHAKRYPTWAEIRQVRDWVFPDSMEVVMVLPRVDDYVNVSKNCFHLWQSACQKETG